MRRTRSRAPLEGAARDEDVGAPARGIEVAVEGGHVPPPDLGLEDRYLALPAAVGVADDPALVELHLTDGIHGPELGALDPQALHAPGRRCGECR